MERDKYPISALLHRLDDEHWPVMLSVEVLPDRTLVAAWLVDFPGCIAQGDNVNEAIAGLRAMLPPFWAFNVGLDQNEMEKKKPSPVASATLDSVRLSHGNQEWASMTWAAGTLRLADPAPRQADVAS